MSELPVPPIPRPSLAEHAAVWSVALIPAVVKLVCYPRYPGSDDAFIHLSIVRNLAEGAGWGIQPGEVVNLSSSPLFTLFLLGLWGAGLQGLIAGQILSIAFGWAAIVCLHGALTCVLSRPALRVAMVLLAALQVHLWRWNGVVMETTMACFFISVCLWAFHRLVARRSAPAAGWVALGLLSGLGVLARPELGLLGPSMILGMWAVDRRAIVRRAAALAAGLCCVLLAWSCFAVVYFGSLVPTTFYAKTSPLHFWNGDVLRQLAAVTLSGSGPLIVLAAMLLVFVYTRHPGPDVSALRYVAAPASFAFLVLAFYYLKTDGLQSPGRYYLLALHVLPLVLAGTVAAARPLLSSRVVGLVVAASLVAQGGVAVYVNEVRIRPVLEGFEENYWTALRGAAGMLDQICRPGDTVLVEVDIGVVSYERHGACRIADGGALASPELRGLGLQEKISRSSAAYVLESLASLPGGLAARDPSLSLLATWSFRSHSVGDPAGVFYCNIYRTRS